MKNPMNTRSDSLKTIAKMAVVALSALLTLPLAQASTNALGLDSSLNLLTFGDFSVPSSDVQGRVAVGGNASINAYSINTLVGLNALYSGTGLTVGGNLTFRNGAIFGNTLVGGNLSTSAGASFLGNVQVGNNFSANDAWVTASSLTYGGTASGVLGPINTQGGLPTHSSVSPALGINFASEQTRLSNLSLSFDSLVNNGNGYSNDFTGTSNFVLDAKNANVAVFDLTASDVLKNLSIANLGPNTTVLINISGETVNFGQHGYDGFAAGRVLFNLPQATQVTFASSVNASFLAPLASFYTPIGGLISGQVVAANWIGKGQVNDAAFNGNIAAVPEPQEYALMLAGLATVGVFARRRRA
jgi:choice-of-anchor A domain-containing protein